MGKRLEQTLAVLNGLIGDYLSRTHNGLATEMAFRHGGVALLLEREALARAFQSPQRRVVVLVHGLMSTEDVWKMPDGTDYGTLLERDLAFSALYVRYNSGLPIADNGAQLSELLLRLLAEYPVELEELLLVGHSMGGLVVRSACHVAKTAGHAWLGRVRRIVYLGVPHLGAPAERVGKVASGILRRIPNAYTRLIGQLGDLRSSGIQDLGHADLRHEDRALERSLWALRDARHPVPLLPEIEHYLIAGAVIGDPRLAVFFGDALVPLASATFARQADTLIPQERVKVLPRVGHLALASHPEVYSALRSICEAAT